MSIPSSGWSVPSSGWVTPKPESGAPSVPQSGWSVPQSGWKTPGSPNPIATPHDFDGIIKAVSDKYGLQTGILRSLGMQESGLGHGGGFNLKTGTDTDPSNRGHGIWQLDPASGATPEELSQVAKDPHYAAEYAAKMMQKNLAATHGDLRGALAMYNAGSPTSSAGLRYADQVLNRMQSMDPIHLGPLTDPQVSTRVQWHANHLLKAIQNKKDPIKSLSHTPELAGITQHENELKDQWHWFKGHALEGLGDILGTPMRANQDLQAEMHAHQDPNTQGGIVGFFNWNDLANTAHTFISSNTERAAMLRRFNQAIWKPSATVQAKLQEGWRQETNKGVSSATGGAIKNLFPSNGQVDHFIRAHTWAPAAGALSATAQTANDFVQQTLADPLTGVDLAGRAGVRIIEGVVQKGLQGTAGVLRASYGLLHPTAQAPFAHLQTWAQQAENLGDRMFTVRRDLDHVGFTRDGKRMRMAIEGSEEAKKSERLKTIKEVSADPQQSAQYYLRQVAEHGSARNSRIAQSHDLYNGPKFSSSTGSTGPRDVGLDLQDILDPQLDAAGRKEALSTLNDDIYKSEIGRRSQDLFSDSPHLFTGSKADLNRIDLDTNEKITKFVNNSPDAIKFLQNIGKRAIMWNPLPHGLVNVGTLTYMAGGLPAVMRGLSAMVRPVEEADIQFLKEHGALPTHMLEQYEGSNPVLRFGSAVEHRSQALLEHIELGWRVGLMKTLEKTMGPAESVEDKLLRGWLINDKVGDYRNQNAFVKLFKALGGPFASFHLGIVPQMFMQTLRDNPERIKYFQRLGQDLQQHAADPTKRYISDSSPVSEGSKLLAGVASLLKGEIPTYVGDTLNFEDFEDKGHDDEGLMQRINHLGQYYFWPMSIAENGTSIISGTNRPGEEHTRLSEKLMDMILVLLGKRYTAPETPNKIRKEERFIHEGEI